MSGKNGNNGHGVARIEGLECVDLDAQIKPVAQARLFGVLHNIMPITTGGLRLLRTIGSEAQGDELRQFDILRNIATIVVPSLTPDAVDCLSLGQMMTLVTRSAVSAEKVEQIIADVEKKSGRVTTKRARHIAPR